MKNKTDYILYLLVTTGIFLIASLCRIITVKTIHIERYDETIVLLVFILLSTTICIGFVCLIENLFPDIEKSLHKFFSKHTQKIILPERDEFSIQTQQEGILPKKKANIDTDSVYENIRQQAKNKQELCLQKQLGKALDYISQTLPPYLDDKNMELLKNYVTLWSFTNSIEISTSVKISAVLKSIDLYHLGWNIGKLLGKRNDTIALFLKSTFRQHLDDIALSTIEKKLRCNDPCIIKLEDSFKK